VIDVDIRYLPGQDPTSLLEEVRAIPAVTYGAAAGPPAGDGRPRVAPLCADADPMSVSFLRAGVPALEFGPVEWVSVSSPKSYRQALESFLQAIPEQLDE
jgi:hypothetical protein